MDLRRGKDSFGTKMFKIEQIIGDIVD